LRVVLCPRVHVLIWVRCSWVKDEWRARHGLLLLRLPLCMGMCFGLWGLCLWLRLRLRLKLGLLLQSHALRLRLCLNGYPRLSMVQLWFKLSVNLRLELDLGLLLLALRLPRGLSLSRRRSREGFGLLGRLLVIVGCFRCWIWLHVCRLGLRLRGLLHRLRRGLYLRLRLRLGRQLWLWSTI